MGLHVPLRVVRSASAVVHLPTAPSKARRRVYARTAAAEARALELGFCRFLELHGRSLTIPSDGCRLRISPPSRGGVVVLDFWSRRAAEDFDYFWSRYRAAYVDSGTLEAVTRRPAVA
jgi:hypothetical protein